MSRFKNLLNYAVNCVERYKVRTIVVLICLGISASVFSSVAFMKDGLVKEGELSLKYSPDLTVQGISSGRQTFIETKYVGYIQEAPGVSAVAGRIWGYGNIGNSLLVVVGIDLENPIVDLSQVYPIESGAFLNPQSDNTVVIGKAVAISSRG